MQSLRFAHRVWTLAPLLAILAASCAEPNKLPTDPDPPDEELPPNPVECKLDGTFNIDSIAIIKGACDLEVQDKTLEMRSTTGPLLLDFDDTSWAVGTKDAKRCTANFQGPDNWFYNGTSRTRVMDVTVTGDKISGEMTDLLQGMDSSGKTCDATFRIQATRTGPPSPGAPIGSSCGPVGCSGDLCAFGAQYECASGICLLQTFPKLDSLCTEPCDPKVGCSNGLVCKQADEVWDGAAPGYYCAPFYAICGNNQIEADEVCDDGNTKGGDGCSADCKSNETCGDGVVQVTKGEQCESTAPKEWVNCTADCKLDVPAGVVTPLPIDTIQPEAASGGPGVFFVGGTVDRFTEPQNNYDIYVARTINNGATWTQTQFKIPDGIPELGSIAARGQQVAVAILDSFTANGFWLAESTDGGATYNASTFQTLPEGAVQGVVGGSDKRSLTLHYAADGGLLALTALADTVVVSRRAPGQSIWKTAGKLVMPNGGGSCTYWWHPPRLDSTWTPGVHLHDDGQRIQITAGQECAGSHSALTMESVDNGASFGAIVDLVAASGLTKAQQVNVSAGPQGKLGVCLVGTNAMAMNAAFCAAAPASGAPWQFADAQATWDNAFVHAPDAATVLGSNTLLYSHISYSDQAVYVHRSSDAGLTWSMLPIPSAGFATRALFPVSADSLWLFEVDDGSDASLVRVGNNGMVATPREYLFGDARRLNGSYPWGIATAYDGTGATLLAFSVPDDLRKAVTVVRILK